MKATKIVYLVHCLVYSIMAKNDPQTLRDTNAQLFHDWELVCKKRWETAIDRFEPGVIYAQLYGGQEMLEYARQALGDDRVIAPSAAVPPSQDAEEYKLLLSESFRTQLAEKGHEIDPQTVEMEVWGQSFEGCAYFYGTGLARHLGLKNPPIEPFEMTVPDARFLYKAEVVDSFTIEGTAVRGYVFDGAEGYPIGFFMDGFLEGDGSDSGSISIPLDSGHVQVVSKMGITLFSHFQVARPDRIIHIGPERDHEGISGDAEHVEMPLGKDWFILGRSVNPETFLTAMRNATVDAW